MEVYECPICHLHYEKEETRQECEDWCKTHSSCNLTTARKSIQAKKGKFFSK